MRLENVKAFLAVAETGSFQKAAKQRSVTQSTISRQIQNLEDSLGTPLFHRSSTAKLTVAGDCFLAHARRIDREWAVAMEEISDLMGGQQTELCVAGIQSVCAYQLPPVLQRFCKEFPQIQLRLTALGSDRALKVLRDGLVDMAIVQNNRLLTSTAEMVIDVLYEEPIQVLMSADHPLTQFEIIPWSQLARYSQVVFKDGYGMQRLVQEQFRLQGESLHAALELNTLEAFRGIVRQGDLITLLPQSALQEFDADDSLAVRPTEEPVIAREVALVTTQDRLEIPPIARFRALVHQMIATPQMVERLSA
ncbi:LysR family transcriptional regulator [filamentous cyanobacterium LEGE 11480]|uniref:LysR family transcriptional regulator n=1 Tax=Romeriopsis navalis LEGE 11480 TaxID=2777977 RepID=A0A928VPE0_9CYAN|nr:LysR family transcriptional regulator [Romeriopsis navalis]MBE9032040.1 LysR family transcriptional regulator [Romeriopsis navalis LEGE 11480]